MRVLSLFDGMACGALALQAASIEIESYDAFEIDNYAIKTALHNFPFIKQHGDVFEADFTKFKGVDLVCGGSPCTYWSIAQKNNRETEASGMGWELFQQYVRAIKEAEPKYFVYENNKSMSKAIRQSIDDAFGFEAVLINSALVSAQNRQRLYWVGKRNEDGTYSKVDIAQPEDRGIHLKDILDGMTDREKARAVIGSIGRTTTREYFKKQQNTMTFEPVNTTPEGKAQTIKAQYQKTSVANICCYSSTYGASGVAEPVRIGTYPNEAKNQDKHDSQQYRIYSTEGKSVTLCGGGGMGAKTGLYAIPVEFNGDIPTKAKSGSDGKLYDVYEVKNGLITIKGKQYEIKLADGFYIIRKLTVSECKRLQTVPEWYEFPVSDTQAYKMLGNGWTVDVIAHILTHIKENERINEMELKIQSVTFPEVIEFNFEELKTEITAKVENYKNLVYTDEQIGIAKTDLANLRKFTKALSDERIKVKKDCLKPYEVFEQKIKELTAIVDEGITNIDKQVKDYDEQKKSEKLKEIVSYFNEIEHPEWLYLESIFSEKWLNASVKMSAVKEEIDIRLIQIEKHLEILAEMPEFAFEATEAYKMSLDINKAIEEGKRLADIAKRKAEAEASSEKAGTDMATAASNMQNCAKAIAQELEETQWISFKARLSVDDAKALKEFFNSRNIQFEKI